MNKNLVFHAIHGRESFNFVKNSIKHFLYKTKIVCIEYILNYLLSTPKGLLYLFKYSWMLCVISFVRRKIK